MADETLDLLPFPVAGPYRLLKTESQPSNGVFRIFDVLEMAVRYLSACVACERLAAGDAAALEPWLGRPLSLGSMVGWLREALRAPAPDGSFAAALASPWKESQKAVDLLVAERNRTRGHGLVSSDRRYRQLRGELAPHLEAILGSLHATARFRPIVIKGMNDFDGSRYEHQVQVATGENPYFPIETVKTDRPLPFRRVYLWEPGNALVPLKPFFVYEACPECDEEHLFVFQALDPGKRSYVNPLKGCPFVVRPAAEDEAAGEDRTRTEAPRGEPTREPAPGLVLGGRYRLEKELGSGAGGRVFLGADQPSGTAVAVKILRQPTVAAGTGSEARTRQAVERFQREVRSLSRVKHPGLTAVLDVGLDGGLHYFVTEFVQGEDLAAVLRRSRPPVERAVEIGVQLCEVLDVVHAAGIVHRDLKPGNVMVQPDGRVKLLDFGVARLLGATTVTEAVEVVGTAGYMAPEQVDGRPVDGRADLFSLGVLLYELMTGKKPFDAPTFNETLSRILSVHPPPPLNLNPDLPRWLDPVVMRLLAKSADDRPATAIEALKLLTQRETGKPARARFAALFQRRELASPDLEHPCPVQVSGLGMRFGPRRKVLDGLSLNVPRGLRYALLGRNGCGKTTLIRCLTGIYWPQAGDIRLLGASRSRRPEINRHVGYIPETPTASPSLRLGRFLSFLAGLHPFWDQRFALELLARWELDPETRIGSLSRGMQTMVSVVAALGHRPSLLLLDDPTLGLDAFWTESFLEAIAEQARHTTVLFSTHNFEAVETLADRVGFLDQGRICREIEVRDLPRRFCFVRLVLPDDREPPRLPQPFTVLERRNRTLEGVYEITDERPEDAFAFLHPDSFETRPAGLKSIYFHVLRRQREVRG